VLAPAAGEWEELNQRHTRLAHAQQLMQAANDALESLDSGEDHAARFIHRAKQALISQSHIEASFETLAQQLSAIEDQITDLCRDLNGWLRKSDLDPDALAALDERLAQWQAWPGASSVRPKPCMNCGRNGSRPCQPWTPKPMWLHLNSTPSVCSTPSWIRPLG
jgi:hypothetical protein